MCKNSCGGCTACCYAFPVVELEKDAWTRCDYATEGGCSIYEKRPLSCSQLMCAYLQMPYEVPVDLRPDVCGVIFERANGTMVGTIIGDISEVIRGQINAFHKEGFGVVLRREDDST